ncbi:neurofilament medium polypeptide-like [Zingiber officinale]|nr:neurofilament medium polypeptide-like [Zingiber officinale]XP_042403139.1 neurofilament medium polypeptide-like [Zingiber officinale]XP_042403141.1 neurofilament medium polypeptide-like [Zingiber officinale]XP_042403142.1 neurofilament medium polypeptide-like [Zingiber officinale]XP_042403143.1 neurofilament medium polypeptide-like [Zingiber officinale]XP_042403144.1 neurofilament medium polypeptide-like [Zingiber officinale]XP_042403145.1 neurofilament medium polypeptide-like [Zingiber of
MEKIVSDDSNIADELNLPKPEDVAGAEARDEEKEEDIVIEEAKEEISIPVEDRGSHDTTDVPDTPQLAEDSEASIAEDPVGTSEELGLSEIVTEEEKTVQESIKDASVETDDKTPEPPSVSIAQELADATVDINGVEPPVDSLKEPSVSETVAEEVKGIDESSKVSGADNSNIVEHDNPVEPASESIAHEPSQPTFVEEKPADEEVSTNAVEVSPQIPKEELPLDGTSDVVPSEPKEVQVETLVAEKNVDHNVSETIEVAEHVTKPELDAKQENLEENLDNEMTTSTETTQSIAEGVVSKDARDENLEGQNSNLVELSRDIKMVEAESNVPSDDKQCESKELETQLKDTFENENTEDKEQDTRSLTETKADEEVIKAELSGKKPKTIISKVKQSIVKVKKALIGKSPSSKTMAPERIDETKAK